MDTHEDLGRIRSAGRVGLWIVLAVLAACVVYAAAMAIVNWQAIGV